MGWKRNQRLSSDRVLEGVRFYVELAARNSCKHGTVCFLALLWYSLLLLRLGGPYLVGPGGKLLRADDNFAVGVGLAEHPGPGLR